ncbi:MAG: hypothetical protein EPN97_14655 [Alphaproteobacteria bacterium]|nr:MAG: hypothetical protein EPN97_14655 [Alphaproteobacteria bacterium]
MTSEYRKEDDYTLSVTNTLPSGGSICRMFNFASRQVTTIFREKAEMQGEMRAYGSDGGVSVARAVALTSQMQIQKFSELDSLEEVDLMRRELIRRGGNPPEASEALDKPKSAVAKLG